MQQISNDMIWYRDRWYREEESEDVTLVAKT